MDVAAKLTWMYSQRPIEELNIHYAYAPHLINNGFLKIICQIVANSDLTNAEIFLCLNV